jgi:hypothetical protein
VRAAFVLAVAALEKSEVPSKIRPTNKRLTEKEWLAVLEAARRKVGRREVTV